MRPCLGSRSAASYHWAQRAQRFCWTRVFFINPQVSQKSSKDHAAGPLRYALGRSLFTSSVVTFAILIAKVACTHALAAYSQNEPSDKYC